MRDLKGVLEPDNGKFKTGLKICKREDITKNLGYKIAKDASMDVSKWKDIKDK